MPIGNITPKTSSLTLTSMLLGSEEYPSSVQQAEGANTGYLLYTPVSLWSGNFHASNTGLGEMGTTSSKVLMNAGQYDLYAYAVGAASVSVKIDGTTIVSGTNNIGTLASWAAATDGWYDVDAVSAGSLALSWHIFSRQYE